MTKLQTKNEETTGIEFHWWQIPLAIFIIWPIMDLYMNFWLKPIVLFMFRIWDRYLA